MFWGLIIEPHKRYTQVVEKSFHVSMASLDVSTAGTYTGVVQVMMNYENRNYLLCTLQKGTTLQVPLDLNFQEGTKIAFTSNGTGHVHLTGYLVPEDDDFDDILEDEDIEEEEEDDEAVPQLVGKQGKRKATEAMNQSQNSIKRSKQKSEEESSEDEDNEEDDDSEDPFILEEVDDEEEDDEDVDEEEEDEEDEEEEVEEVKPVAKKNKQEKKQPQQQQQQQTKKQDKQKLVNGKEGKQEQKQEKKSKVEQQQNNKQEQKKRVIEGGVQVEDLKVGAGKPAKSGKFISVYYVGRLKNGQKFDSCSQGEGFKFRLGKKEVIQGWDVGIAGMKIGGKRRITIPPALAYGAKGSPPVIPPNSTLVFEVELKNVH